MGNGVVLCNYGNIIDANVLIRKLGLAAGSCNHLNYNKILRNTFLHSKCYLCTMYRLKIIHFYKKKEPQ